MIQQWIRCESGCTFHVELGLYVYVLLVRLHFKSIGSSAANMPLQLHELRLLMDQTLTCVGSTEMPNVQLEK